MPTTIGIQPMGNHVAKDGQVIRAWLTEFAPLCTPMYEAAVRMVNDRDFPGRVTLVSHAAREIRNRLADNLVDIQRAPRVEYKNLVEPISKLLQSDDPEATEMARVKVRDLVEEHDAASEWTQKAKVQELFRALAVDGSTPPSFVSGTWEDATDWVEERMHIGKEVSQEREDNLATQFASFEALIKVLAARAHQNMDRLDEIVSLPFSEELADELLLLSVRPENRRYVFARLEGHGWVPALDKRGFFSSPQPRTMDEPGNPSYTFWSEGYYLLRVAENCPEEVCEVLKSQRMVSDTSAAEILTQTALRLPDSHLLGLQHEIRELVESLDLNDSWRSVVAIVERFLPSQPDFALQISKRLLVIQRSVKREGNSQSKYQFGTGPTARMSEVDYEEALTEVVALYTAHPDIRFLDVLLSSADAVSWELSYQDGGGLREISLFWRPSISDHPQNEMSGIGPATVDAARDYAVTLASVDPEQAVLILRILEKKGFQLARRIRLHTMAAGVTPTRGLSPTLCDPAILDNMAMRREVAELLRSRFAELSIDEQHGVLNAIDEHVGRSTGLLGGGADVDHARKMRLRDWYSYINSGLDPGRSAVYDRLIADLGVPEHPEFAFWSSSDTGEQVDPSQRVSFEGLSPSSLLEEIDSMSGAFVEPNRTVLELEIAMAIQSVVAEAPREFSGGASLFIGQGHSVISAFFSGLRSTGGEASEMDWGDVLKLAKFATAKLDEPDEVQHRQDSSWGSCRRAIALCLWKGVEHDFAAWPNAIHQPLFDLLVNLCANDDTPDIHSSGPIKGELLALNATASLSLNAVFSILESEPGEWILPKDEVFGLVNRILEPDRTDARAVRGALAQWFPTIHRRSPSWSEDLAPLVFDSSTPAGTEAWRVLLRTAAVSESLFSVLDLQYASACSRLGKNGLEEDQLLLFHLWDLYLAGIVDNELLSPALFSAADSASSRVMESLGWRLSHAETVDTETEERLLDFWDHCAASIKRGEDGSRAVALGFGWWFASGKLDDTRMLGILSHVVTSLGDIDNLRGVAKRLAHIIRNHPEATQSAVSCLASLCRRPKLTFLPRTWGREAMEIVVSTATSTDQEIVEDSKVIADYMLAVGIEDFRQIEWPT